MTRPSAPAVITTTALLGWAGTAYAYAYITGNRYAGAFGVLFTAAAAITARRMWNTPAEEDLNVPAWVNTVAIPDYVPAEWTGGDQ
jgi:hypothetical protein